MHFLDFFLLALLAFRAFFYSPRPFFHLWAGEKAFVFSLLYGAFLEWAQRGVSGRVASLTDWGADALGALVATGIFRISRLTRPGQRVTLPPAKTP
ncbi:MAG: VanZ family protein [Candidatus Omnitrophica bacterium]|nr:VanZ family protein [Candidatus Omnitrophota bacterium]